jgi:hypothetical protein
MGESFCLKPKIGKYAYVLGRSANGQLTLPSYDGFCKTNEEPDDQAGGGGETMTATKRRIAALVLAAMVAAMGVVASSAATADNAYAAMISQLGSGNWATDPQYIEARSISDSSKNPIPIPPDVPT